MIQLSDSFTYKRLIKFTLPTIFTMVFLISLNVEFFIISHLFPSNSTSVRYFAINKFKDSSCYSIDFFIS